MVTSDEEFLNEMERRADEYIGYFTGQETHRLWQLCGYSIPPPDIRRYYVQGRIREHVQIARKRIVKQVLERLTR